MADDAPSLQIDTDWKKQAQEEKRRLAEQEKAREQAAPTASTAGPAVAAPSATRDRTGREMPEPSFAALVQSIVTQALFYLGDLAVRGGEPVVNLDMAKHHIDILGILEQKTVNNLTEDEKRLLDSALYETRMRYVNVASQYIS
jgi:hypothetical protein